MRSGHHGRGCPRFPSLEQRSDDHGARAECDKRHRVADEIESALAGRHENLLAVYRLERSENLLRTVSAGNEPHHISMHRRRNTAREISGATRVHVEITSALTMDLMLEIVALR